MPTRVRPHAPLGSNSVTPDDSPKIEPIPVGRTTLADLVLERLITAIGDGDLAQGAQLRDAVLADALSVSRMPVRQALQRLEQIGP